MNATVLQIEVIVSNPDIRNGRPVVAGTGICVSDIVARHNYEGLTPEDIAVQYQLSLGEVYAALAYYYMHKADIDAEMRNNADEAQRLRDMLEKQGKVIRLE